MRLRYNASGEAAQPRGWRSLSQASTVARAFSPAYVWSLAIVTNVFGSGARAKSSATLAGVTHRVPLGGNVEHGPAGQLLERGVQERFRQGREFGQAQPVHIRRP